MGLLDAKNARLPTRRKTFLLASATRRFLISSRGKARRHAQSQIIISCQPSRYPSSQSRARSPLKEIASRLPENVKNDGKVRSLTTACHLPLNVFEPYSAAMSAEDPDCFDNSSRCDGEDRFPYRDYPTSNRIAAGHERTHVACTYFRFA